MKRLPEESEPEMLGWFAACLILSAVVVMAFILLGDATAPATARMAALPQLAASNEGLVADCPRPAEGKREICTVAGATVIVSDTDSRIEPRL
jgi:hypothetical protein